MSLRQPRLRPPSREFLRYLAVAGLVVAVSLVAPQLPAQLLRNFLRGRRHFDRDKLRRLGSRLAARGLVKVSERGELLTFRLTEAGQRLAQQFSLERLAISRPAVWDRAWRVVLFDIPEHARPARDALRAALRRLGFAQIQWSVFAHPYPCEAEVEQVVRAFNLERSVILFTATTLSDDSRLRRKFGLTN
ncbi:hypothetical protein HYW67_04140 [Candidatus Parcubacteria bacterium]|nr:hypothetical protein [Candidatus Parcubacteria bacterium]